jgi:transcription termination factor Rho
VSRRRYSRPRANPPQRYRQDDRPVAVAAVVALEAKDVIELRKMATDQEIPEVVDLSKDDLIQKLMEVNGADGGAGQDLFQTGILEIIDEGYGFLRRDQHWLPSRDDIYVSQSQIRRFGLRTGDEVSGQVRNPKNGEKYQGLVRVVAVNSMDPEATVGRPLFERLTPIFPDEHLVLEHDKKEMTTRIIDLVAPIGRGQRGLIVSPPKAGKTEVMKRVAQGLLERYTDLHIIVALIGERPEEVTDWQRSIDAEVISSTFDETPDSHCRVAEMTIARAKRLVESGKNIVVFLDSITRLSRAYNLSVPASGKTLSGGIDPAALVPPKTFFGSGRNIEGGGSLTMLASCLIDTGSRMDEVIYEEFKGTGNWELILNRKLSERGTFPAVDVLRSGTRRVELLLDEDNNKTLWLLRRMLSAVGDESAIELMMDQIRKTETNEQFLETLTKQSL